MYIENIVIDSPIVDPSMIFACDDKDWEDNEKIKTCYTSDRFLPKILKEIGIVKSTSEVKRNKPKLCIFLNGPDFLEVKWGKKKCWILVGVDKQQEYINKAFKLKKTNKESNSKDVDMNYINKIIGGNKND
ncbi:MAG: hypothetical protein LIR50_01165 [Bacillota bacterium]|nr:hypothetical protein [Bacillota bacterium]